DVVTENTGPFKVLFEVLKDMLTETNIEFIASSKKNDVDLKEENENDDDNEEKNEDEKDVDENEEENNEDQELKDKKKKRKDTMKIAAIDTTKKVLINLTLDADNISKFTYKKNKILKAVILGCFYKLIFDSEKKIDY